MSKCRLTKSFSLHFFKRFPGAFRERGGGIFLAVNFQKKFGANCLKFYYIERSIPSVSKLLRQNKHIILEKI